MVIQYLVFSEIHHTVVTILVVVQMPYGYMILMIMLIGFMVHDH